MTTAATKPKRKRAKKKTATRAPLKTTLDPGIRCVHCNETHGHHVTHTYPNGNRRYMCGACNRPFMAIRERARQL